MRKLVLFIHVSLDGYAASKDRELSWAYVDDEIFKYSMAATEKADTALYGRNTYEIMQYYWPTAGKKPGASGHDKQHSKWYNSVEKIVISNSLKDNSSAAARVIRGNVADQVMELKNKPGKDILMLGSPTAAHALMERGLIDEYNLFINPILLGGGIPVFAPLAYAEKLVIIGKKFFSQGVVGLFYKRQE